MSRSATKTIADTRALIADDDAGVRLTLRALLEQKGFAVTEVDNGLEAVEAVSGSAFDIALLDIRMPQMDGFDACESFRKLEFGKNLPILMLTGQDDTDSIERAFEVGATDFVAKPINPVLLGFRIDYILRAANISEELRKSQQRSRYAQRIANLGHIEWNADREIVHCSKGILEILHLPVQSQLASLDDFIELVHPEDRVRVEDEIGRALENGDALSLEHRVVRSDGRVRFVLQITEPRPEPDSSGRLVATLQDITDRIDIEKRMHALAYYDDLTGLPNRNLLIQHLDQLLKGAVRYDQKTAVIVFGVDKFDKVVESLDHRSVENLIRMIAERINNTCRECDLLSRQPQGEADDQGAVCRQLAAKLKNDEYVIVLSAINSLQAASAFLHRLSERFSSAFQIGNRKIFVSTSAGISLAPIDGNSSNQLIKYAEIAKGFALEGSSSFRYFKQELNDQVMRKFSLAADLRKALTDGALEVHYQPRLRLSDQALMGVEALCRWQHPALGPIAPVEFIQIAEEEGLIGELGGWVLETACDQLARWQADFNWDFGISVNISPEQLLDEQAMRRIVEYVSSCPIENRLVEFELTESTWLANFESSLNILSRLTDLGCGLAIDDFGTGYSSLSYLGRLPAKTLKIDKSFIQRIDTSDQYRAIVSGIVKLAHSLALNVVAEGVENDLQKVILGNEQCDEIQGILVGPPVSPQRFAAWYRDREAGSTGTDHDFNETGLDSRWRPNYSTR